MIGPPQNANNEKSAARRLVEAAAWRTHFTETGVESSREFDSWLAQDLENQHAWNEVQSSWDFFDEQPTAPELLDLRRRALGQARSAARLRWTRGSVGDTWSRWTVAAGVALVVLTGILGWNFSGADVYRTNAGERRQVTLADGSTVQLDSATELRVRYSERARELTLKRGQVRFEVARDVERPFSVLAGARKVVATGTAFNVDLLGPELFVTLIEGHVVVLPKEARKTQASLQATAVRGSSLPEARGDAEQGARPMALNSDLIELAAGQELSVSASGTASIRRADVRRATAWQSGQLVFDNEALSSVIERVNRYATRPLSLADEQTANLKISGVFNTGDVDGFVSTITHYLPIEARVTARTVRLSHR